MEAFAEGHGPRVRRQGEQEKATETTAHSFRNRGKKLEQVEPGWRRLWPVEVAHQCVCVLFCVSIKCVCVG